MIHAPINTALANSSNSNTRSRSFGMFQLVTHLFGNALSPPIVGLISDKTNIQTALFVFPLAILIASIVWAIAWRCIKEPQNALDAYNTLDKCNIDVSSIEDDEL